MQFFNFILWTVISAVLNIILPFQATMMTGWNLFHPEFIAVVIMGNAVVAFRHAYNF